ncbi:exonuclease domain-containing protein [Pseudomonas sp. MDMC_285]|nr:exonuclease domain-containing protein [Pseudomonas sp. MDMC_285]
MTAAFAPAAALQGRALAVVEVKTTGVHPARDAIWELAIIQVDVDGTVEARLHWLFEPGVAVPPPLLSLAGLHPLELRGQPRIECEAQTIAEAIRGRVLVGQTCASAWRSCAACCPSGSACAHPSCAHCAWPERHCQSWRAAVSMHSVRMSASRGFSAIVRCRMPRLSLPWPGSC